MVDSGISVCDDCEDKPQDMRRNKCKTCVKTHQDNATSTNTEQSIANSQEQGNGDTGQSEALHGQVLTCPVCSYVLELVDNMLITQDRSAQVPVSKEFNAASDWLTMLDTLPVGIAHPTQQPDGSLSHVHERILRRGMKKADWLDTQAYAEQIKRYLYWTEAELLAKEHIIPEWVKPRLKARGAPK